MTPSRSIPLLTAIVAAALVIVTSAAAQPSGDAEKGRVLFLAKECGRCHVQGGGGGGPALEQLKRPQGSFHLVGRMWNHVPAMWTATSQGGYRWPELSVGEMTDLMAYLGADGTRDPAPDAGKGQVVLLRKGCLKCHSFRREGGTVQPDLATARPDYESAAAWATTMWTHTPRMVKAMSAQNVPYPRFAGDEMTNLLGFLRKGATGAPAGGSGTTPGR